MFVCLCLFLRQVVFVCLCKYSWYIAIWYIIIYTYWHGLQFEAFLKFFWGMLNTKRQSHAGTYEAEYEEGEGLAPPGTSRFTYEHGFKCVHCPGKNQIFCSGDGLRVCIYIYNIFVSGTHMTTVLIGKNFLVKGWSTKIEDKQVLGICIVRMVLQNSRRKTLKSTTSWGSGGNRPIGGNIWECGYCSQKDNIKEWRDLSATDWSRRGRLCCTRLPLCF